VRDADPEEYRRANAACLVATREFQIASSAIDTHLLAGSTPTPSELKSEETTRIRVILAQRDLYSLGAASAKTSTFAAADGDEIDGDVHVESRPAPSAHPSETPASVGLLLNHASETTSSPQEMKDPRSRT
jgi:hypothetical protein